MVRSGVRGFAGVLVAALWAASCSSGDTVGGVSEDAAGSNGPDASMREDSTDKVDGRAQRDGTTRPHDGDSGHDGASGHDVENGHDATGQGCGGESGPACGNGKICNVGSDCASDSCQAGKCVPATCMDGIKNGGETNVDCGGQVCAGCPAGDSCAGPADCASDVCTSGVCQAPSPTDGVKNDSETDVDCGGSSSPTTDGASPCTVGKTCVVGSDCAEGVCAVSSPPTVDGGASAPTCQPPTATDGVKNDSETDVDCGGGASSTTDGASPCGNGKGCLVPSDCVSQVCANNVCQDPSATDGVKNDSETDIDCGGGASPTTDGALACVDGKSCLVGTDCKDLVCATGPVMMPSPNGKPIDCPAGATCTCQAPTPTDGVDNDSETDIDCGGVKSGTSDGAQVCAVGKHCLVGTDCAQGVCNATAGGGNGPTDCPAGDTCVCQAASPTDGVENDSETDVDCGGGTSPTTDGAPVCGEGKKCLVGADCNEGVCNANGNNGGGPINCPVGSSCVCQKAAPNDGVKNDSEIGVDCGGASLPTSDGAPGCAEGSPCTVAVDCLSGFCSTLSHTCVAGQSCMGLEPTAQIMDVTGTNANGDATGTPDPHGVGQHAGIDTCGRGESTDATGQVHESCCRSLEIPTSVLPSGDAPGTLLDKYEVTAGRVRQFVEYVNAVETPVSGYAYDMQDWMAAQFNAAKTMATTAIGTRFMAQIPAGTTVAAIIGLMPHDDYGLFNIVESLGATTMDTNYPSDSQGCYVNDGSDGAATYWWPSALANDAAGDGPRPFTQDYYDIKPMNCAPYWIYAAFCAWDGGHVASIAELDAVYGGQQYPWDTAGENTFLPASYTYTTMGGFEYQTFVPGTPEYSGPTSTLTAVDLTVNWNNNSFLGNSGSFYFYPNGGHGPASVPSAVATGTDLSPYIAAPGRFYLDKTAILSPTNSEGWQDLGANMLEMTETATGGSEVFCDCSTGGQATSSGKCIDISVTPNVTATCPNGGFPVVRNGGLGLPTVRWEGGSWEGHETALPSSAPYFNSSDYSEPLQTQYGKAGFRCARPPP